MKKMVLFVLMFVIPVLFLSAAAQDAVPEVFTFGEWDCIEYNGEIALTGYRGEETNLEIPAEINGEPVTQLGKELFKNNQRLESVIIPESVTRTSANLFSGCTALKTVQLPDTMRGIDSGTFQYCTALEEISIPFSVSMIRDYAFADCINLKSVNLLGVTSIGESAFDNCQSLTEVISSKKMTAVGSHAFRDTPWLEAQTDEFVFMGKAVLIQYNGTDAYVDIPFGTTMISGAFEENLFIESVTIPETVREIGRYSFREARNLKEINIPQFTDSIGNSAFEGCTGLTEINFPKNIKNLGNSAFKGCDNLTEVIIPASVTAIPAYLFVDCTSLRDVVIPGTVTSIGKMAFANNAPDIKLQVAYGSEAELYAQENEILFSYATQETGDFLYKKDQDGITIIRYIGTLYDVEIPAEIDGTPVVDIDPGAFQNNSRVRRVIVPLTVKGISSWAFSYMDSLEYVRLPENLESIGANAFTGDAALKELRLPKNLVSIGEDPIDAEAATVICAYDDSAAAEKMKAMGYEVNAWDKCSEEADMLKLWADLASLGVVSAECDCSQCGSPDVSASVKLPANMSIIRIPDGVTRITADMIEYSEKELILVVPASVTLIDADVPDGHNLTIVADAGGYAEQFARENDIRFTVWNITVLGR